MAEVKSRTGKTGKGGRVSVVEDAYDRLKEKIINNEFPPGYQALEQELADQLKVSRTPVREILTRLEDDGLIERLPRRGFRVLPIMPKDFREIYELLDCLESKAVELLTEREPPLEGKVLRDLEKAITEAEAALAADDLDTWAEADKKFHRLIIVNCGNERLARTAFSVWDQFRRADMVTLRLRPKPVDSPPEHRKVLDAIRRRDSAAARQRLHEHRRNGMNTLMQVLDHFRLRHI